MGREKICVQYLMGILLLSKENSGAEKKQLYALKLGIHRKKTLAVNNKNNKPAEFLIKGLWWDNSVKWGAPVSSTSAPKPPKKRKGRCWKGYRATRSFLSEGEMWQEGAASLHGAIRGCGPRHVNVGPRPAVRNVGSTQAFSVYASVFACPRFVCTLLPQLDAEQQGNPKTTQFFILPFLFCDAFRPPSLPPTVVFQPSGFRDEPFDRISWTLQA